jgi:hypothetical protein
MYAKDWRKYKLANRAAGLWLLLGLPGVFALAILFKLAIGELALVALLVLVPLWAVAWLALCIRVTRFPCPRCKGLYFGHRQLYYGAGRQCAHCGLPLYGSV